MSIRNWPLRRKIFLANCLILLVPILLIIFSLAAGVLFIFGLGGNELGFVGLLMPKKGQTIFIQYAVATLRYEFSQPAKLRYKKAMKNIRVLEQAGMSVAARFPDGRLYVTPGADALAIHREVDDAVGKAATVYHWDENGLVFRYTNGVQKKLLERDIADAAQPYIEVRGSKTFRTNVTAADLDFRRYVEYAVIAIIGFSLLAAVVAGAYIARMLVHEFLHPLENLNGAIEATKRGDFSTELPPSSPDEVGRLVESFRAMQTQLRADAVERERYEENRRILLAGISHDLSTPLTAIKGYASAVLDGIAKTPEKERHYLTNILERSSTMEKLVQRLFLFSKLDLGKIDFQLVATDLGAFLADYLGEGEELFAAHKMHVRLFRPDYPLYAKIDYAHFPRVIDNIISNSAKYRKGESVHIDVTLTAENGKIKLVFADDGQGVAAAERGKIFTNFYRTDEARSHIEKGSGLGLAITRRIVSGLGGEIRADDSPLGGLAIVITLPKTDKDTGKDEIDEP